MRGFSTASVFERAFGERIAHRLFDLALRGDPDHLEEFADVHVEAVFVHHSSSSARTGPGCAALSAEIDPPAAPGNAVLDPNLCPAPCLSIFFRSR